MSRTHLEVESAKGRQTIVPTGDELRMRLSALLRRKNLPLNTRCGERGLCDGCLVELLEGHLFHIATNELVAAQQPAALVRGCEYRLAEGKPARIHVRPRSLLAYEPQVVVDFRINVPRAHDPLWQQIELSRSELAGGVGEAIARRRHGQRPVRVAAGVGMPKSDRPIVTTEYHGDHWLVTDMADKPLAGTLGAAIDIGTTTVAVLVVDLSNGQIVGRVAGFNRQMNFGDDVLTRINLCGTNPEMLGKMQSAILNDTIAPLLLEAGATPDRLKCVTLAGNTTMLHLLAGVDPSTMGYVPFAPAFLDHRVHLAKDLPFTMPALDFNTPVHLLPGAAAYVGADLVAGMFASGLAYDAGPSLLVDVGTNGEIILKYNDHVLGCATAAGPAFEGAGLSSGVRASDGAIERIELSTSPLTVHTEVIGNLKPTGICGSAYVDFLAQARTVGLIGPTGRFDLNLGGEVVVPWEDYGHALRVAHGPTDICISELDIARLLQAKAAIAAGILTLLERVGMTPQQVKKVYLAGGFGMHLDVEHTIRCGMLPGFRPEQIEVVGNTSLAGAYLALLDTGVLDELKRIGKKIDVIELNLDPGFESRYIDQLMLP